MAFPIKRNQELIEMLSREGLSVSISFSGYSGVDPAVNGILSRDYLKDKVPAGEDVFIKGFFLTANKNIKIRLQNPDTNWPFGLSSGITQTDRKFNLEKNKTTYIPFNSFISYGTDIAIKFVENLDTADTGTLKVEGGVDAIQVSYNRDLTANKVVLAVWDSIGRGTGSTNTTPYDPFLQKVKNFLRDRGQRVKLINRSISSATSTIMETARKHDWLEVDQVDLILYGLGVNDAPSGTSIQTTFQSNIDAFIAYKQTRYPNAKLIICGATPLQNATNEGYLAQLRSIAQARVNAANDPKIFYCSLGTAFDNTVAGNYLTGESPNGVHPTQQTAIATVITNYLTTNNISI